MIVDYYGNQGDFYYFITKKSNVVAVVIATLVLAAGAATAGVALAGYIPQWGGYLGMGVVVADCVAAVAFLALRLPRQKKRVEPEAIPALSKDPLGQVFKHLNKKDLASVQLVCKKWRAVATPIQWQRFVEKHDWREENPYPDAFTSMHLVGKKNPPAPITRPKFKSLDYALSGNHLVFLEDDGKVVHVWRIGSKNKEEQLTPCKRHKFEGSKIRSVGCYGETVYFGLDNGEVEVRKLVGGTATNKWKAHKGAVEEIKVTKNGIITYGNGAYRTWGLTNTSRWLRGFCTNVKVCALTDSHFCIDWAEVQTQAIYRDSLWKNDNVTAMCAYNDKIICGNNDGTIKLWDLITWKYAKIPGHPSAITHLCLSGNILVSQAKDGAIQMYDLIKQKSLKGISQKHHPHKLIGVTAGMVITASDTEFKIWDYRK